MSSFAVNQTNSNLNVDSHTNPSIFEVLAQQSLANGLRRAANQLKDILYANNSQKFDFLCKNFDEIYLLIDICVQLSHLRTFSASFSEHFYSLKRVSVQNNSGLNRKQFYSSLVVLTIFPYLKTKIDDLFENLKLKHLDRHSENESKIFEKLFIKSYPTIRTVLKLISLCYQISYTVGKNIFSSPLLKLTNVRLINLDDNDIREIRRTDNSVDPNIDWFTYFAKLSVSSTKYLAKGFTIGLSVSAFFIQFLDYWYSSDNSTTSFAPLPIPPPPQILKIEIPNELCPICLKLRENDTALMTTGYVFCYSCLTSHLKDNSRCPVTGYPSNFNHLIKIYPPVR